MTEDKRPFDMGIAVGNTALLLIGVFALTVAHCFKKFERRIEAIEH
jgi:hypothetical protein